MATADAAAAAFAAAFYEHFSCAFSLPLLHIAHKIYVYVYVFYKLRCTRI